MVDQITKHTPLPWDGKPHIMDDSYSCNCTSWCEIGHAGGVLSVEVNNGIESISEGDNDAPAFEEAKANAIFVDKAIHSYYPLLEAIKDARVALELEVAYRKQDLSLFVSQAMSLLDAALEKAV